MSIDALFAVQDAIYDALAADPTLTTLLGGSRIYDRVPDGATPPYVVFGAHSLREAGDDAPAQEQLLTLTVWTGDDARKPGFEIATRIEALLHDAALPLSGHTLANLRLAGADIARQPNARLTQTSLRFRAVTHGAA